MDIERWKREYRGEQFGQSTEPTVNSFQPFVDSIVKMVIDGFIDLDEVDGAAYMVREIIRDHQRRDPEWRPKTAAERKAGPIPRRSRIRR